MVPSSRWLGHCPFTATTWVQVPLELLWRCSSEEEQSVVSAKVVGSIPIFSAKKIIVQNTVTSLQTKKLLCSFFLDFYFLDIAQWWSSAFIRQRMVVQVHLSRLFTRLVPGGLFSLIRKMWLVQYQRRVLLTRRSDGYSSGSYKVDKWVQLPIRV